jgi:tetratricopeptide (TPR) repeat protein
MLTYKGTTKKSSEIAKELNVSAVISGEVRREGDEVEIIFELIDGRNDTLLGGGKVARNYRDILTLHGEAALAIARKIQSTLTPEETRALSEKKRVIIQEAYDAYLKGKQILDQTGAGWLLQPAQVDESLALFDQALKIDPEFALAFAGKALAYDFYISITGQPIKYIPKAREAALTAQRLDDSLAEPPMVLADCLFAEWNFEAGKREFERVLKRYPNHAYAHAFYASNIPVFSAELAVVHGDRASELDPMNYTLAELCAGSYFMAGDFKRTTDLARKMVALYPNKPEAHWMLAWHLPWIGRFKEAMAEYQRSIELGFPDEPLDRAYHFAMSGERDKAIGLLEDFLKQGKEINNFVLAVLYSILDDKDAAFQWLDRQYEERSNFMPVIKYAPYFENIRSDPRYEVLLRKIGLEK